MKMVCSTNVLLVFCCDGSFSLAVPASPPDNVTAVAVSDTVILVTWHEVPSIDQNGIIIQYDVEYSLPQISDSQMMISINVDDFSNLELNITGLQAYTEYSIRVRAHTSVGAGPYSDVVNATTFQNGNLGIIILVTFVNNCCLILQCLHPHQAISLLLLSRQLFSEWAGNHCLPLAQQVLLCSMRWNSLRTYLMISQGYSTLLSTRKH